MKPTRSFRSFITLLVGMLVLAGCGVGGGTSAPASNSGGTSATSAASSGGATSATSAASSGGGTAAADGLPKIAKKDKYKVGFAQTESNNPWRLAQTASMKAEAEKRGYELVYTDAAGSAAKQVSDVDSMIAQKVDAIFLAPREEKPLAQAVLKAKAAGIPVILLDRNVDLTIAKPTQDFVTFIGSDFIKEGQRAAEWLAKATNNKATIIELEGTTGSSPANDRKKGFEDFLKDKPDMKVVASQTGDFARDKGRQVMETLLQAHPDVTAVYAHNDEMAIGAITALQAAGKQPGKDVIVVSIDGEKDALQAIIDGTLGATVECNPRFGPSAFDTLETYIKGEQIADKIINPDNFYDSNNAKNEIANSY